MESLFTNTAWVLLFVLLMFQKKREGVRMFTLSIKVKKTLLLSLMIFALSSVLFAGDSYALFEELTQKGSEIFMGMRDIIYVVAGFGIIGLFVIATTAAFINYVAYGKSGSQIAGITDSLK